MARVLFVHGIGQQRSSSSSLHGRLIAELNAGLRGQCDPLPAQDFACAFYADLFVPMGAKAAGEPPYDDTDLTAAEAELLELWWREAARTDAAVPGPREPAKVRTPRSAQLVLSALSRSAFFAGIAERTLIGDLKQVTAYFGPLRRQIRARVREAISPQTRVVIGHSLGSVVAYETLAAPEPSGVRVFVTLGSPLGVRNMIFDRLEPPPVNGRGVWPGTVSHWINVADEGDAVAIDKRLSRLFGDRVRDSIVYNGTHAHDAAAYLRAPVTGEAIALGLRD